jgi:aryl-alcohol dehydrogenase-like predicted oxidoreductase
MGKVNSMLYRDFGKTGWQVSVIGMGTWNIGNSNYMSLFGHDIEAGETVSARSRLVVLPDPTEAEILGIADAFLRASS